MPPNSLAAVTGARSCTPPAHPALTCNLHSNAVSAAAQRRDQPASTEHVQSHSFQQASASTSLNNADVSDRAERQTAASDPSKHCTLTEDQQVSDLVQPDSDQASRSDQASAKLGLADPNKRLLARMGSSNAAGASVQLMHEVGVRASIQGVLQVWIQSSSCNLAVGPCVSVVPKCTFIFTSCYVLLCHAIKVQTLCPQASWSTEL